MKKFPTPTDYAPSYEEFLEHEELMRAVPSEQEINLPQKLVTSADCVAKYGKPEAERHMVLWDIPKELEIGAIPKRLYCNKDIVKPLAMAFKNLIETGYVGELLTWDGCFNIRMKRNGSSWSLHSWGIAIDLNAAWNGMGKKPILSKGFVNCFKAAGFHWGGDWKSPDGMHFQLSSI